MQLEIIKTSPSRNTTILVKTPVPRAEQPLVAERLLDPDHVGGEQVCFWEPPTRFGARARMQMMGGEFCVNATMSLAVCLLREDGLKDATYRIDASGCDAPILCEARESGDAYIGIVPFPGPATVEWIDFDGQALPVVHLPGIAHAIAPSTLCEAFRAGRYSIRDWSRRVPEDAFGVLFGDEERIRPLVYVRSTDTAVYEKACGSGSAAMAAFTALRDRENKRLWIQQEGGVIEAAARYERGVVERMEVTGRVRVTMEGTAWIE